MTDLTAFANIEHVQSLLREAIERAEKAERERDATALLYRHAKKCVDDAEQQLAALRASHAWWPIETAPKDGKPMIVAWRSFHGFLIAGEAYQRVGDGDGWWWANTGPGDYESEPLMPSPTHWMPLPSPPTGEQKP